MKFKQQKLCQRWEVYTTLIHEQDNFLKKPHSKRLISLLKVESKRLTSALADHIRKYIPKMIQTRQVIFQIGSW